MNNKKSQIDLLSILMGILIIVGGIFIIFKIIDIGTLLVTIGLLGEIIREVIERRLL